MSLVVHYTAFVRKHITDECIEKFILPTLFNHMVNIHSPPAAFVFFVENGIQKVRLYPNFQTDTTCQWNVPPSYLTHKPFQKRFLFHFEKDDQDILSGEIWIYQETENYLMVL